MWGMSKLWENIKSIIMSVVALTGNVYLLFIIYKSICIWDVILFNHYKWGYWNILDNIVIDRSWWTVLPFLSQVNDSITPEGEEGVARGNDALCLFEHIPTRNQFINEVLEVRTFWDVFSFMHRDQQWNEKAEESKMFKISMLYE